MFFPLGASYVEPNLQKLSGTEEGTELLLRASLIQLCASLLGGTDQVKADALAVKVFLWMMP